jgi:hypothetical protein
MNYRWELGLSYGLLYPHVVSQVSEPVVSRSAVEVRAAELCRVSAPNPGACLPSYRSSRHVASTRERTAH